MNRKRTGQIIEPLTLTSIQGMPVRIPHPTGLTHLQFRRFAGCPICNVHLQSFVRAHDRLIAHGIQEVVVFHSSKAALLKHTPDTRFALIADPHKSLYQAFGVESSLMSVLHPKTWLPSLVGPFRHGMGFPENGQSPLGLPADFLIAPNGQVLAAKYGTHANDHWEVADVLTWATATEPV